MTINYSLIFYTSFALLAFAGNSVLCRMALAEQNIDAISFTVIRLFSAALVLFVLFRASKPTTENTDTGGWLAGLALFLYAICFSIAYINLDTGTGALILFGVVQLTMILYSYKSGNRLCLQEWLGVVIAISGLTYLVLPTLSTPSFSGFLLMAVAGIAWAIYTLLGKNSKNALSSTTYNFVRTVPLAAVFVASAYFVLAPQWHITGQGIVLATISGVITSGIGYTIWYKALPLLKATQAGVLQLLVPVIATFGGVFFNNESVSVELTISTALILIGVLLVILNKARA